MPSRPVPVLLADLHRQSIARGTRRHGSVHSPRTQPIDQRIRGHPHAGRIGYPETDWTQLKHDEPARNQHSFDALGLRNSRPTTSPRTTCLATIWSTGTTHRIRRQHLERDSRHAAQSVAAKWCRCIRSTREGPAASNAHTDLSEAHCIAGVHRVASQLRGLSGARLAPG